jgi:hypothetical protein
MRYSLPTILLICQFAQAGGPAPPPVFERWDAAYVGGVRAGYVRTSVTPKAGQLVGLVELRLKIKRMSEVLQVGMDTGTFETPDGVVTGVFRKILLGQTQQTEIQGKVEGNRLILTENKTKPLEPAPWNDLVVGLGRQQRLFQEQKLKPGDQFSYLSFEPSINLVVTMRVEAKDFEMVELAGAGKQNLLRVEVKADRVQTFQPPPLTIWLDETYAQLKSEVRDVPGFGKMTFVKTTRAQALLPAEVAGQTLEEQRVIPLKVRLPRPHDMASAIYRIRIKDDKNPVAGFSEDKRQKPSNVKGDTFDMTVRRVVVADAEKVGPEYLESSHFINSADAQVREHARRAIGTEQDPWKKAVKIERYVLKEMKPSAHELLATADHVARTLKGDCTEYAMLTTAMCRAAGVPSRTALGLVYGEVRGQPAFIFHMWTEVWVGGQWAGLDATLGRSGIGAAHLKIADHSWRNESSMTPLLSTLNLLGRVSIEVVRVE